VGPYADRSVAERLRAELAAVGERPPSVQVVMRWRPRQRDHVERWAAREALVRAGGTTLMSLPRPAVLDRTPSPLRADYRATMDRHARDRAQHHDPAYLAVVRTLPCIARWMDPRNCGGLSDPHHAGEGLAHPDPERRKTCDRTAVPLCRYHHRAVETLTKCFGMWNKGLRRQWYDRWIAETQAQVAEARSAPG